MGAFDMSIDQILQKKPKELQSLKLSFWYFFSSFGIMHFLSFSGESKILATECFYWKSSNYCHRRLF